MDEITKNFEQAGMQLEKKRAEEDRALKKKREKEDETRLEKYRQAIAKLEDEEDKRERKRVRSLAPSPSPPFSPPQMSAFELKRQQNIAENRKILGIATLGFTTPKKKAKNRSTTNTPQSSTPPQRSRRSSRNKKGEQGKHHVEIESKTVRGGWVCR